jgi:ribA/ribD-fused uncharacterized protein
MKTIKEFQGEYRWLSNFTPVEIILDGIKYSSVEHAYMSAKSDEISWKDFCSDSLNSPGKVKSNSKYITLIENWDDLKVSVMEKCIDQKYDQEPFKTQLIATGDAHIQEGNLWNDKFWGICLKTGEGKNMLGKLIMKKRIDLEPDFWKQ